MLKCAQASNDTCPYDPKNLHARPKRPPITDIPDVRTNDKRDLGIWKQRPNQTAKEANYHLVYLRAVDAPLSLVRTASRSRCKCEV